MPRSSGVKINFFKSTPSIYNAFSISVLLILPYLAVYLKFIKHSNNGESNSLIRINISSISYFLSAFYLPAAVLLFPRSGA